MRLAFIIIFFSVVFFPWLIINLKVTHTIVKFKRVTFSKPLTIFLVWLIPFYGAYLAAQKIKIDWGQPKYDDTSGPYGTIGNNE